MFNVIVSMLDEHGVFQRVADGQASGTREEIRGRVEKMLRTNLVTHEWRWETLIIECYDEADLKDYRDSQRILERMVLNSNHASFPCGRRTAYYSHSGGDGSALTKNSQPSAHYIKDLNLLYEIFETELGYSPSRKGENSITLDGPQLTRLREVTGLTAWFLQTWLNSPKDSYGVIKKY